MHAHAPPASGLPQLYLLAGARAVRAPGHSAKIITPLASHTPPSPPPSLKAKRGGLANTDAIDMLTAVLKGVLDQTRIDPKVGGGAVSGTALSFSLGGLIQTKGKGCVGTAAPEGAHPPQDDHHFGSVSVE